ncbi:MAG: PAS domain S-box protein [Candidatus Zixiibacteriota bacterium]
MKRLFRKANGFSGGDATEKHYQKILSNLPVGIFRSTTNGQFLEVNPAMVTIFGYDSADELKSVYIPDMYADLDVRKANIHELGEGQKNVFFETRMLRKDGSSVWISSNVTAVYDDNGQIAYMDGALIDITGRKKAEQRLLNSEEQYRNLFENVPIGLCVTDPNGRLLLGNRELFEITGYDESSPETKNIASIYVNPDIRTHLIEKVLREGQVRDFEIQVRRKDGSIANLLLNTEVVDKEGRRVLFTSIRDISREKKTREALVESERRFRMQHEFSPLGYQSLDQHGTILDINPAWLKMTGYERTDVVGKWFGEFLLWPDKSTFQRGFEKFLSEDKDKTVHLEMRRKDGGAIKVELTGKIGEREENGVVRVHCMLQDITGRIRMEDMLRESLKEKDVLIREIHHRVKNNLQVISSLLDFHANLVDNKEATGIFERCQRRITAMSLIHEQLFKATDFSHINMQNYIRTLTEQLVTSYQPESISVDLQLDVIDDTFTIEKAIPCGLIINELIANIFKHAFVDNHGNKIVLSLRRELDTITLRIADNGIGIKDSVDPDNPNTLGLQLVSLLVRQIGGKVRVSNHDGTDFTITLDKSFLN